MHQRTKIPVFMVAVAGLASMATSQAPSWSHLTTADSVEAMITSEKPRASWRLTVDGNNEAFTGGKTKADEFSLAVMTDAQLPADGSSIGIRCTLRREGSDEILAQTDATQNKVGCVARCDIEAPWRDAACGKADDCTGSLVASVELTSGTSSQLTMYASAEIGSSSDNEFEGSGDLQLNLTVTPVE